MSKAPGPAAPAADMLGNRPVSALLGVGPALAERLERLGIRSVQDLLFHLPARYEDRTRVAPMGSVRPGDRCLVDGQVDLAQVKMGRRRSLVCRISDGTGAMHLRFFHFSRAQREALARGVRLWCFGEVRAGPTGPEMVHPEYRVHEPDSSPAVEASLTPIYPTTEGIRQGTMRRLTDQALDLLSGDTLEDYLPEGEQQRLGLPPLAPALRAAHRPAPAGDGDPGREGLDRARGRLAFEELLAHHLGLRQLRARLDQQQAPPLAGTGTLRAPFLDALGFPLTEAQRRVSREIEDDLVRARPMHRLVQGDVGSGKTVVAALAALQAVEAGCQVALMAPTELLVEQHLGNFRRWLEPLGVAVAGLAGTQGSREREALLTAIAGGEARVVIGTHALFQSGVDFDRLGLAVIDEQHRFGVHQRLALRNKGARGEEVPHQLVMTATPIPRTLAMAAYADLDTSLIDELPPGRTPVETVVVPGTRRDEVIERVRAACGEGQQAYWVCTLIDESEALQCQAASDTAALLTERLPGLRVGLVHGRLKGAEKDAVMEAFAGGTIDLLVATTVIEVGVDVPRASLMIIDNAERLGLAQLHQLRGRVGRGARRSACVLMYTPPLSANARERLAVLRETGDGFRIAQRDLELRGPGEVLGTRQTGMLSFRVADLLRDRGLYPDVVRVAGVMLHSHPQQIAPLVQRWVGNTVNYADA